MKNRPRITQLVSGKAREGLRASVSDFRVSWALLGDITVPRDLKA